MPGPYDDLDPDDRARAEASDATLAGIIAARRAAARALLAPAEPANAVRAAWAAITNRTRP